jgi:hypothetical protein
MPVIYPILLNPESLEMDLENTVALATFQIQKMRVS